jgi:hypothetical protein
MLETKVAYLVNHTQELAYVVSIGKEPSVGVFRTLADAEAFAAISINCGYDASILVTTLDWTGVGK